jgi:hypothetical protein
MTLIDKVLPAMTSDERRGALMALDAVTRPLTAREIEHALRRAGVSVKASRRLISGFRGVSIVAVTGEGASHE